MCKFTDIHTHILYDVDDGAINMEMSQQMIACAYANHTRKIICTPHYGIKRLKADRKTVLTHFIRLRSWVKEQYPDMGFYLGQEVYFSNGIEWEKKRKNLLPMAESNYLLVEFPVEAPFSYVRQGMQKVQMEGYRPIFAHVERCQTMLDNQEYIKELIGMGIHMQLNVSSILGNGGWSVKRKVRKLLDERLIHFVASDSHRIDVRTPELKKGYDKVVKICGETYARQLFEENPNKILENQEII